MAFESTDIMSEEEILGLFSDDGGQEPPKENPADNGQEQQKTTEENQDIDFENLFDTTPESVGSEGNNKEHGDTSSGKGSSSPYVLSSLAKSLKEEGILLDLDDEEIAGIKDSEGFKEVIEKQIKAKLDERQRRIDDALDNGVEPSVIKSFENALSQLNSITPEQLNAESEQAELWRRNIIRQDYINKGFSKERAERETENSFKNGTDKDDAKEALQSIKGTIQAQYQKALDDAKEQETSFKEEMKKQAESLRKSVLDDKQLFGELELDKATRQKVLDTIIKPVWRDPDTGDTFTAIQKYEKENKVDFLRKVGIIFTLTDGFKNFDGLVKSQVKKEVNKGLKELENTLNNTQRNGDGSLNFTAGVADSESFLKGFSLDV